MKENRDFLFGRLYGLQVWAAGERSIKLSPMAYEDRPMNITTRCHNWLLTKAGTMDEARLAAYTDRHMELVLQIMMAGGFDDRPLHYGWLDGAATEWERLGV